MTMNFDLRTAILKVDFTKQLRALRASGRLKEFIPELAAMESESKQHKDNVEHSIQVLENAQQLSEDKNDAVLFAAALFHDVGKPATLSFEKGKATFQHHEHVGAAMARKFLRKYGFSKQEISEIVILIREHMRGHTFKEGWSESAIRRLAKEAGSVRQIERLSIIFASDATTKNKARRASFRANAFELRNAMLTVLKEDELKARRPAINGNDVMELTGLKPGRELGAIMKFLNSEEGLALNSAEARAYVLGTRNA